MPKEGWTTFVVGEDEKLPLDIDPMADRRDVVNQVIGEYADGLRAAADRAGNPIVQQIIGTIAGALDEASQKRE